MDTTYFGRKWGVMVLYDAISKRALSVLEVKNETIERYRQEVAALQERGVVIQSVSKKAPVLSITPKKREGLFFVRDSRSARAKRDKH